METIVHSESRSARRGYLLVLAAATCWATSGTFIRLIVEQYRVPAWTLAFWRDVLTFSAFLSISLITDPRRLRVARRDLLPLAAMGAFSVGLFHVLWVMAVTMIPVAVATVLNYTAPVFVVLIAWVAWGERPDRRKTTALALAFVGCLLVTGAYNIGDDQLNWPGLLVGLSTGLTYGLFTIIGKDVLRRYDSWTVLTYAFGFAALTLLILQPRAVLPMFNMPMGAWAWVVTLVLMSTVTGFGFYAHGLKHLSASSASITATIEPVIAAGVAFVLLGQVVGFVQGVGGALVIAAVILLAL
jgi:DME family drug/metabolite transporter